MNRRKIVIAAGGTGGHLFPAQALAEQLESEGFEITFMGSGLSDNRYFDRARYAYEEIPSATLFQRKLIPIFQSLLLLARGVKKSLALLNKEGPDLVIGFGSFHSFPVLSAARLQKREVILFESNAYPGKVNRFFSPKAAYTAVVFLKAQQHLRGKVVEVEMPIRKVSDRPSSETVENYFGLEAGCPTLLIFGGSQGASAMNELVINGIETLRPHCPDFQVIHITGQPQVVERFKQAYDSLQIRACVKAFETNMPIAYQAASLAICRAGAATISELIAFSTPSILIPFPFAADDHQVKNAQFVQQEVKGGVCIQEKGLTKEVLAMEIYSLLDASQSRLEQMKQSLNAYRWRHHREQLCALVCKTLKNKA